VKLYFFELK